MINVTQFIPYNVIDSCAISNVLSSRLLYSAALASRCEFCCTYFVEYEVLHKKHQLPSPKKSEMQDRFRAEKASGKFTTYHLSIEDLFDIEALEHKKKLSKGELSSILWAKKTGQAFLTDDQNARTLGAAEIDASRVQTTPQLLGWLVFEGFLSDSDKDHVIQQHVEHDRPLKPWLEQAYQQAIEYRLRQYHSRPSTAIT